MIRTIKSWFRRRWKRNHNVVERVRPVKLSLEQALIVCERRKTKWLRD